MAKRSLAASLVALLIAASMLAVAALTADAAPVRIQELGFGTSSDGQISCPTNIDPNQVCETHSVSGQVFGSPIRHGTFTGTMVLGSVSPGPLQLSCGSFTGTIFLGTIDPGPPNVQSLLAVTLSGIHCVGPGGGCIEAGTFAIDGDASTGQFQGASGQGRFGALIGPNGEVVLGLRTG